jgi:hypothetical protein
MSTPPPLPEVTEAALVNFFQNVYGEEDVADLVGALAARLGNDAPLARLWLAEWSALQRQDFPRWQLCNGSEYGDAALRQWLPERHPAVAAARASINCATNCPLASYRRRLEPRRAGEVCEGFSRWRENPAAWPAAPACLSRNLA